MDLKQQEQNISKQEVVIGSFNKVCKHWQIQKSKKKREPVLEYWTVMRVQFG